MATKKPDIITESDGFFDFIGLAPGTYYAKVDEAQMVKLQMKASPTYRFKITLNKDGDVIDGLKFVVENMH